MSHDYRGRVLVVAFLSLTIVWSVAVGFDATDGSLCEDHCGKTFPVHTYPEQPPKLAACERGCRMLQIENLLSSTPQSNSTECLYGCDSAYLKDGDLKFACRVGCQADLSKKMQTVEEDVWVFYQFNEMEFLKKLVNMLDWKEEGSITVADGMNVIVTSQGSYGENVDMVGISYQLNFKNNQPLELTYSEVHMSQEGSNLKIGETRFTGIVSEDISDNMWDCDCESSDVFSCMDRSRWHSLFDVFLIVLVILIMIAIIDYLSLGRSDKEKKRPVMTVIKGDFKKMKKPLYVQDSNRMTYADSSEKKEKYVEGTLTIINPAVKA